MARRSNVLPFSCNGLLASLAFLVDFAAVTDLMDNDHPVLVKRFVDYPLVSFAVLEQAREITFQRFGRDLLEMLSQPLDSVNDSVSHGWVEFLQLATGVLEDARSEHY